MTLQLIWTWIASSNEMNFQYLKFEGLIDQFSVPHTTVSTYKGEINPVTLKNWTLLSRIIGQQVVARYFLAYVVWYLFFLSMETVQ